MTDWIVKGARAECQQELDAALARISELVTELADMTSQRNGWGDTAREYLSERDAARAEVKRLEEHLRRVIHKPDPEHDPW